MKSKTKEEEMSKVLTVKDLMEILPFGRTKLFKLLQLRILPVVKVGNEYITTQKLIEQWIEDNIGKELTL